MVWKVMFLFQGCILRFQPLIFRGVTSTCFTGWWLNQPMWKICASQNGFIFLNFRGKNIKYLSCHHLVQHWLDVCWVWSNQPPFLFFHFPLLLSHGVCLSHLEIYITKTDPSFLYPASTWWPRKCFRRCKDSQQTLWTSGDHGGLSKFRA